MVLLPAKHSSLSASTNIAGRVVLLQVQCGRSLFFLQVTVNFSAVNVEVFVYKMYSTIFLYYNCFRITNKNLDNDISITMSFHNYFFFPPQVHLGVCGTLKMGYSGPIKLVETRKIITSWLSLILHPANIMWTLYKGGK